jgi:hypothetical protein
MKTRKNIVAAVIAFNAIIAVSSVARGEDEITDAKCENLVTGDIPVADYQHDLVLPQDSITVNQNYNTSYDDGYWYGSTWMYGHDGLDTEGASDTPGVNDVYAILPGVVILSKRYGLTGGWGESIIVATRMNAFSEEILTHHYHHLHATGEGDSYETTRLFNACDALAGGESIAKEGTTGNSNGSHLHISVRLWENLKTLNDAIEDGGKNLYGYGYVFGTVSKLARNLDPEGFLFNTFRDYQWGDGEAPSYIWSFPYALKMRRLGVHFGLYDGRFGAGEHVTRRQAARWMKIGAMRVSENPATETFTDVPKTDPDFPYIESLVRFPSEHPVLDPDHSCENGGKYFCPEDGLKRAEALKMVIMAFYGDEFIQEYVHSIWTQSYDMAIITLGIFVDVPAIAWYAPYIYFGVTKGLVTSQDFFHPVDEITKEELAKWIVTGVENITGPSDSICEGVVCPEGRYCSTDGAGCAEMPTCVPSESHACEVGGGYVEPYPDAGTCQQGQTSCGNNCCNLDQYCDNGYCLQQQNCPCSSGICCDGCNYRPAGDVCDQWYVYGCEGPNPGQNARKATVRKYCTGQSAVCDGQQEQLGWQTDQDCSLSQVCQVVNGMPECVGNCTDTYTADASSACYGNPQGSGTPTLCLEVQKNSGASFRYRICKDTGTYQNSFTYRLKDDNNMVNFTQYDGSAGLTCTTWKDFSVSYVTAYGTVNGAGLEAEVISPAGCAQSQCRYKTGTVTVSKECL